MILLGIAALALLVALLILVEERMEHARRMRRTIRLIERWPS